MGKFYDLTGQRFGRLTVSRRDANSGNQPKWLCRCDCGGERIVFGVNLRFGRTNSCGCIVVENNKAMSTGRQEYMRAYRIWGGMKQRCLNSSHHAYPDYGGRGIGVCQRWAADFGAFLEDMGDAPAGLTLDRIDNDRGYEPGNCRWATRKEQCRNKRNNIALTFRGRTQKIFDWASELGIPRKRIYDRLIHGWTIERALTSPKRVNGSC